MKAIIFLLVVWTGNLTNGAKKGDLIMSYDDSYKILKSIRSKYFCKGEIVFKCAIQNVVDCGIQNLTEDSLEEWIKSIDIKHDKAESEGKILLVTRDFEKTVAECTFKIAEVPPIDFLMYVQREVWFYNPSITSEEVSYVRAIELLQNTVEYSLQDVETSIAKEDLEYIGFEDDELVFLGYEKVFFDEDDYE